jgi:hypothetical protein
MEGSTSGDPGRDEQFTSRPADIGDLYFFIDSEKALKGNGAVLNIPNNQEGALTFDVAVDGCE